MFGRFLISRLMLLALGLVVVVRGVAAVPESAPASRQEDFDAKVVAVRLGFTDVEGEPLSEQAHKIAEVLALIRRNNPQLSSIHPKGYAGHIDIKLSADELKKLQKIYWDQIKANGDESRRTHQRYTTVKVPVLSSSGNADLDRLNTKLGGRWGLGLSEKFKEGHCLQAHFDKPLTIDASKLVRKYAAIHGVLDAAKNDGNSEGDSLQDDMQMDLKDGRWNIDFRHSWSGVGECVAWGCRNSEHWTFTVADGKILATDHKTDIVAPNAGPIEIGPIPATSSER